MDDLLDRLKSLSSAEDFLSFFGVRFDQHVVDVNRLHILKRFHQYLRQAEGIADLDDPSRYQRYRELLSRAHDDFARSSARDERVFRVFDRAAGVQSVPLASLRDNLHARHLRTGAA